LDLNITFNSRPVYVCLCKVATDTDVKSAIAAGARTVEDVGDACGAGTGCGACRPMIHEMLQSRAGADCPAPRIPVALPLAR
jgi:bacterioferritin-associated ferredoxin